MARPYLDVDGRAKFLTDHGYVTEEITQAELTRLESVNFHYFLGYARNLRMLCSGPTVHGELSVSRVFELIDLDSSLRSVTFDALGRMEWRLRSCLVKSYCAHFDPCGSYVSPDAYETLTPSAEPLHLVISDQVLRSKEPWIVDYVSQRRVRSDAHSHGSPSNPNFPDLTIFDDLPIWAAVDTFSLRTMIRLIGEKSPAVTGERLSSAVADELSIPRNRVLRHLEAVNALRNLVAHHSRLWMRPATVTTSALRSREKMLRHRDIHHQSQYVSILALADVLGAHGDGAQYLDRVESILANNSYFRHGVCKGAVSSPKIP